MCRLYIIKAFEIVVRFFFSLFSPDFFLPLLCFLLLNSLFYWQVLLLLSFWNIFRRFWILKNFFENFDFFESLINTNHFKASFMSFFYYLGFLQVAFVWGYNSLVLKIPNVFFQIKHFVFFNKTKIVLQYLFLITSDEIQKREANFVSELFFLSHRKMNTPSYFPRKVDYIVDVIFFYLNFSIHKMYSILHCLFPFCNSHSQINIKRFFIEIPRNSLIRKVF